MERSLLTNKSEKVMKKAYIEPKTKIIEIKSHKMFATSDPTNGFGDNANNGDEGDAKDESMDFDW